MRRRLPLGDDNQDLKTLLEQLANAETNRLSLEDQQAMIEAFRSESPASAPMLDRWFLWEVNELRRGLNHAERFQTELRALHERLTSPPWHAAVFLRVADADANRVVVSYQGTPRVVALADDAILARLTTGTDVLLSHDLNLVLRPLTPSVNRASEVAEFQYMTTDGRLLLKAHDLEVIAQAAGSLDTSLLQCGDRVRWDSGLALAFERLSRQTQSTFQLSEAPAERFADIGGLDSQIERLQRAVLMHMRHADVVSRYKLKRASSVLLVGPPGTGKTLIARALANWLGELSPEGHAHFMHIKPGALHSMWYSQSEANYREVFRIARHHAATHPGALVVLFFDEVDAIGLSRGGGSTQVDDRVLTSFMTELDGLEARGNVLVVAATNRRDALDPALLRPGRLGDLVLEIPRPSMAAAQSILERHLPVGVPYEITSDGLDPRTEVIATALSRLYAPNGEGEVASLTFRDGTRRPVHARELVSGAMLANVARIATERACAREVESGAVGIRRDDVLEAVVDELEGAVAALTPTNCHAHLGGLPQDLAVVRVDASARRPRRPHRSRRAA